ncbi:hypothetical protein [Ghiorsea bivora]|uniref:hypothetical protein n=1 Tax=Ghiorsea bivora TaxID=1485545 RepID=UPI00056E6424|nr:hypothetical protein [Ghiorsea bivora]
MQNTSMLMWGLVFGSIGFGFFSYGRKQKAIVPLLTGMTLMVLPYFVANLYLLLGLGVVLLAIPYFIRL